MRFGWLVLLCLNFGSSALDAQRLVSKLESEVPIKRLELGAQYIYLGNDTCYYIADCHRPPAVAFGPVVALNLTRHIAVDASFNTTAQSQSPPTAFYEGTIAGGRGTALLAGPRFELRRPRYGLFVFGQAGFQAWSQAPGQLTATFLDGGGVVLVRAAPAHATYIATGGGVGGEYSPTPRIHVRASVGERYVHYPYLNGGATCSACPPPSAVWRESEVFNTGVSVSVGSAVHGIGSLSDYVPSHRFFDRTNVSLISGATLAGITDAVVTRHFLFRGLSEGDPIERPFVQNGIGGFVAVGLITETAAIGFIYGLHHMGHHRLERLLPILVMLGEARTSYTVVKNTW